MKQALNLPKKIYFKTGSAPVALRELSDIYHCNRALLITDPKLYLAGVAAPGGRPAASSGNSGGRVLHHW